MQSSHTRNGQAIIKRREKTVKGNYQSMANKNDKQRSVFVGGDPHQLHLGTRIHYYRCSLPGLAGFAVYRREGTNADHHNKPTVSRR